MGLDLIQRLSRIIEGANGSIHFVALTCSKQGILAKLGNESRGKFGKLQDVELYEQIDDQSRFDFPPLPEELPAVDTEEASPEEAALAIEEALDTVV